MTDRRHTDLAKLARAKAEEKDARRLHRAGHVAEAIEAYDRARDLYAATDFAYMSTSSQPATDSDLGDEVQRAIRRCDAIVSNLRYPKTQRPAATTPRPTCLDCNKPLRRFKFDGSTTANGTPREWGDYGDNRFCGRRCGWRWACRNAALPKTRS